MRLVFFTRALRAFIDGVVLVVLPAHLVNLGFSTTQIGAIIASSLLGSAILTLTSGAISHRYPVRTILIITAVIMVTTGFILGFTTAFLPFLLICAVTTMNTSSGDVSPFLSLEQSVLGNSVDAEKRTSTFAKYNLVGSLVGSLGALCAGLPVFLARNLDYSDKSGRQAVFLIYGLLGLVAIALYRQLPREGFVRTKENFTRGLSPRSKKVIFQLSALFSLDSFGGGFATQAIFALWIFSRFDMSIESLGVLFFAAGIISALSSLLAVRISHIIGLVRTMVFTHIPASILLIAVAVSPNVTLAIVFYLMRSLLSQMDVPARTSYVMSVVEPHERAAAASITNVPRSLASALPPFFAGWMLEHSTFAWPLVVCATLKIAYDLILLRLFGERQQEEKTSM